MNNILILLEAFRIELSKLQGYLDTITHECELEIQEEKHGDRS